jgi:hypothetical protein
VARLFSLQRTKRLPITRAMRVAVVDD